MRLENTLTKEQHNIYNHNKFLAWKHFYQEGNGKAKPGHVLHHIDDTLRHNDVERYIQWRIEDLQMMTKSAHMSLHNRGENHPMYGKTFSEETRVKMSESHKGENNPFYGKQHSAETCAKISESMKGVSHGSLSEETKAKLRTKLIGRHNYYDKAGQRFKLFETDQRVINKEVVTLEEYRKIN